MDLIANLNLGFAVAFTTSNLLYCLLGVTLGTLIGVLPGIGPVATIAMLLPITFNLPPESALIMLAGIYYGAQYGGSTSAILVNMPGEASSVVTAMEGYQMARQGRAGAALSVAAIGSFFAGCVGTLLIAAFAPPLAALAFKFGPPERFSLYVLGLVAAVVLAHGSLVKALAMIALGLLLGIIGTDVTSGTQRYTFGIPNLSDGIGFAIVAMGMFGIAEIIRSLENVAKREVFTSNLKGLWPTRDDLRVSWKAILRGTGLGSILGILPGGTAILGSFASYMMEKRLAGPASTFGKGAIQGVAGPEAANNAAAQTSFIPMLTLGIPSNPVMALMVGAMIIQGIQPGPQVMTQRPELFWGMIASMWVGNILLVLLNLPLIGIWVRLLKVPYRLLYPAILLFCCIGVYSLNNNVVDVVLAAVFGLIGYVFIKLDCEPAPLLLAFVLGPMMEEELRRSVNTARGDWMVFFNRPLSLSLLIVAAILLLMIVAPTIRKKREEVFQE